MTGIAQHYNHKVLAINGMLDHVHILVGMRPTQAPSDLMEQLKGSSSKWINEQRFIKTKFAWQDGFGAFSYTKNHVPNVTNYVLNQKEHHKKVSFLDEYRKLLRDSDIEFDERYIFKSLE